MNEFLIP